MSRGREREWVSEECTWGRISKSLAFVLVADGKEEFFSSDDIKRNINSDNKMRNVELLFVYTIWLYGIYPNVYAQECVYVCL